MTPWPALVLGTLLACGPLPGGSLSGNVAAAPEDWTAAVDGDRAICEIESRPADPQSIQLECFVYQGALFVQSHRFVGASWWPFESWAEIWPKEPAVRVRIGDRIYELRAVVVAEPRSRGELLAFRGYDPVPDGIVVFRFESRV